MKSFLKKWLAKREPWVFEHSKVPKYFKPIYGFVPTAITIGPFVFVGSTIEKSTFWHEKTHYIQQWEMLFVGQWVAYAYYFLKGLILTGSSTTAYRLNPFEVEARALSVEGEFESRPLWGWLKYR